MTAPSPLVECYYAIVEEVIQYRPNVPRRINVLGAIADGDAGIIPGDTVRYWQIVVSLADEFVRGGRVVPYLALREDSGVAVWRALPIFHHALWG